MSPRFLRAMRLAAITGAACAAVAGLAACGGDGMSQADIERKVDAASVGEENVGGTSTASDLAREQAQKDADQRAAAEAVKRREELERIQREQKAEAEKVMSGDVAESADSLAEQRFRARLAGVCDGAQERISKVAKAAEKATKTKDPDELLEAAKEYSASLNDFTAALKALDPPAAQQALFAAWLHTIDGLANSIRLQLVSIADQDEYQRLQQKTAKLTTRFLTQTAQLGVTCLTVTS
ncbi:MAG: hypothetical protein QM679_04325 [Patulibacter sp.]